MTVMEIWITEAGAPLCLCWTTQNEIIITFVVVRFFRFSFFISSFLIPVLFRPHGHSAETSDYNFF